MRTILLLITAISFTFCASHSNTTTSMVTLNSKVINDSAKTVSKKQTDIELLLHKISIGLQKK